VGFASLSARSSTTIRTSRGVALARASVAPVTASPPGQITWSAKIAAAPRRDRTVRVSLRRARHAPAGKLRAWACIATPSALERSPCSKAVALGTRATLRLAIAKGQRVRVVIVRARHQ
jgi:hypothetical protein